MIKQSDILTAINLILVKAFPDYTVYVQDCSKDFKRPSFLLEYVKLSLRDVDKLTIVKTVSFKITCFVPVDKYFRSDMDQLANLQDSVLQLFSSGYVKVGDRALRIQGTTGGMGKDLAYIDIQIEFSDNRTDTEEQLPLMESVHTNIKEG